MKNGRLGGPGAASPRRGLQTFHFFINFQCVFFIFFKQFSEGAGLIRGRRSYSRALIVVIIDDDKIFLNVQEITYLQGYRIKFNLFINGLYLSTINIFG